MNPQFVYMTIGTLYGYGVVVVNVVSFVGIDVATVADVADLRVLNKFPTS